MLCGWSLILKFCYCLLKVIDCIGKTKEISVKYENYCYDLNCTYEV